MKNNSTPNQSRVEEYVLIEYLMAFLPADQPDGDDVLLKSTQDIQDAMRDTGYHIHVDSDNRPKWMMMRR